MRTNLKRSLSVLLAFVMLVGMLPTMAFATGGGEEPMKRIDSITMNVPAPTAGSNVSTSTPTTAGNATYYASELGNFWHPVLASGDSHTGTAETVFEDNRWYKLSTTVYAEQGYYFDENTTVTVNNATEAIIFRLENNYSPYSNETVIHAWFKVGEPETATPVNSITVTGLPETTTTTKYKDWNEEIQAALTAQKDSLPGIVSVTSTLYFMDHSKNNFYQFDGSRWSSVSRNDTISEVFLSKNNTLFPSHELETIITESPSQPSKL